MKFIYIMPALMIIESLIAALIYGFAGDVRKTVYWLAAAVITASVTF